MNAFKETLVIAVFTLPSLLFASDGDKKSPSLSQFAVYDATLTNFPGAKFNGALELGVLPDYWSPPVSTNDGSSLRVVSKDNSMAIQFTAFAEESEEVLTWRKDRDNKSFGALTVFKNQAVASHTFSYHGSATTLTREVCELLRSQTNATSLKEFAEKARSCESFYRMKPIPKNLQDALKEYRATHDANVRKLHSSFAKDAFPIGSDKKRSTGDVLGEFIQSFMNGKSQDKTVTPEPRAQVQSLDLFSLKPSQTDGSFRTALSDVAQKCLQFFPPLGKPDAPSGSGGSSGRPTVK